MIALAAGVGVLATLALADRGGSKPGAQSATTAGQSLSTPSSVPSNVVSRVGQVARLDPWSIVVTGYHVVATFRGERAAPGRKWLVAEVAVTNGGTAPQVFTLEDVEARYRVANGWEAVSAHLLDPVVERVASGQTHRRALIFSLPGTARIYTVIFRRGLEAQKNTESAAEVDLNCC